MAYFQIHVVCIFRQGGGYIRVRGDEGMHDDLIMTQGFLGLDNLANNNNIIGEEEVKRSSDILHHDGEDTEAMYGKARKSRSTSTSSVVVLVAVIFIHTIVGPRRNDNEYEYLSL